MGAQSSTAAASGCLPDRRPPGFRPAGGRAILVRMAEQGSRDADDRLLACIQRLGNAVAAERTLGRVVQMVLDEATRLVEASFGAFFDGTDGAGERGPVLHSVSGAAGTILERLDAESIRSLLAPVLAGGAPVRLGDGGGRIVGIDLQSYLGIPVFDDGHLAGVLVFGDRRPHAFTERDERALVGLAGWASVALRSSRLYEHACEAIAARDHVLAVVSHDLRSPLTAISASVDVCLRHNVEQPTRERALRSIRRAVGKARLLVDDLLDASAIAAGRLVLDRDRYLVESLIEAVFEDHLPAAEQAGVTLSRRVEAAPRAFIRVDLERMCQALGNLLVNAIKFTGAGGHVEVRARVEAGRALIEVQDDGAGIDPADLPHVFDRFWHARKKRRAGAGLGLAIAQGIAESHGTRIEVRSALGQGSVFAISLPTEDLGAQPPAEPPEQVVRGDRLLLVDDDPGALETGRRALEAEGLQVEVAAAAHEALACLQRGGFGAVVLDWKLSRCGEDGLALCRDCRRRWPDLRLYVVTDDPGVRPLALAAGATSVLPAPVDFEALSFRLRADLALR